MDDTSTSNLTTSLSSNELKEQPSLLPIEIIETYPSDENTADLTLIGKGRDGRHYAIKTLSDGKGHIPATELFCYKLARYISVPVPNWDIVLLDNGETAFGSVWEGNAHIVKKLAEMFDYLEGNKQVDGLKEFISKVHALDVFVNNIDRHFGNYMFRPSYKDKLISLAYDFSRAWMEISPFGLQSTKVSTNTQKYIGYSKQYKQYDQKVALSTLEEIVSIPKVDIDVILSSMDSSWMSENDKNKILEWWGSESFEKRVQSIRRSL